MRRDSFSSWVLVAALVVLSTACDPVADSHIANNVPAASQFDEFMNRDLQAYFAKRLAQSVHVEYSLLRREPTQSGISYPKYYAWVTVHPHSSNAILVEGAVRVAAMERVRFDITDFLSKSDIVREPKSITGVFPAPVCEEIKKRL